MHEDTQLLTDGLDLTAATICMPEVQRRVLDDMGQPGPVEGLYEALGQEAIWCIRSGSYRIAYTVHRNILRILVPRIGDRKDFYRHFNR